MSDNEFDIDSLHAAERDPLLRGHRGNARRQAILEEVRELLRSKAGDGHSRSLEFADRMGPDSTLEAWETLSGRLEGADPALAGLAASGHALALMDVWGAMGAGADMIPHLASMCRDYEEGRQAGLGEMREGLYTALGHLGDAVKPGPEVLAFISGLARFGSGADDGMTKLLVEMLYIQRDLLEGACDICEEILKFKGPDRDRMAGSTLVEEILLMVLGGLEDRDKGRRGLSVRCGKLLQERADQLDLGTRPNPDDCNKLRPLARFASDISARRQVRPAAELGRHIEGGYPRSHRFLELGKAANLEEMVEGASPLAVNMSAYISLQEIATAQGLPPGGSNALMSLEPMADLLKKAAPRKAVLDKWRDGIRGRQLWESLFEMEMYLRLVQAGADVEPDVKVGSKVVDLEVNGCYAEIYSPLESEVLVPGHVVSVDDPGTHFIKQVLSKGQLGAVGEREVVLVVECPHGMYTNLEFLGKKMACHLGKHVQPGGIFFVRRDSSTRRTYTFLANPGATTPVSESTITLMKGALEALSLIHT